MESKELHQLINKYLTGTASEEESRILLEWYRNELEDEVIWSDDENKSAVKIRLKEKIWSDAFETKVIRPKLFHWKIWSAVAASVVAVVLAFTWWFELRTGDQNIIVHQVHGESNQPENRFVLLPDSSKVVLRPGSSLKFRTDFTGKTREVELVGEGYFDVVRDESRPFIIYSKDVKTVVLGTAFTIKAYEDQSDVSVTVEHGKVRVEKQEEVLAELTANQQLNVEKERDTKPIQKEVVVEEELSWRSDDMRFDAEPFGELIRRLERRYDVKISFVNEGLKGCPISGRFEGVETIDEVLDFLCSTRNATFKRLPSGIYQVNGQSCL